MTILTGSVFMAMLLICIYMMRKIRQQSSRINQLESAIRGESTGKKIPYESLSLLDSLRRQSVLHVPSMLKELRQGGQPEMRVRCLVPYRHKPEEYLSETVRTA